MSGMMQMLLGTSSGEVQNHWFARIGTTSEDQGRAVALDSDGNIYSVGKIEQSGRLTDGYIVKYDADGSVQAQVEVFSSGFIYDELENIAIDGSDNIYVCGRAGSGNGHCYVAKFNTSLTMQWRKSLTGSAFSRFAGVGFDSSGNVYVAGFAPDNSLTGPQDAVIAKYNSSGTLQWQRGLGATSKYSSFSRLFVDSSGNVFACGFTSDGGLVAKYNSSGTLQWHKLIKDSTYDVGSAGGIGTDSSGNIYVAGQSDSANAGNTIYAIKLNSSGAMQWSRTVDHVANRAEQVNGLAVTDSGDMYITGSSYVNNASYTDGIIVKFNSSGTLQFTRTFGNTGSKSETLYNPVLDDNDNLYIAGFTGESSVGNRDILTMKLPSDGSKVGTYGNFTYQSVTKTTTTENYTSNAGTLTGVTSVLGNIDGPNQASSISLTNTTTTL
jgi:uncharacterized delta-60 repeat protein|tara:strand:+ start:4616 stop:5929 length:1314 start_codon:yes stop_codon:yes gene_type:complete